MKNRNKSIWMLSVAMLLMVLGWCQTAAAAALGEGWSIMGYNAGWVLIGVAVLLMVLAYFKIAGSKLVKPFYTFAVVALLIGAAALFVDVEDTTTGEIATGCCDEFEVTGSATTSGTNYIGDAAWDEDTLTLTVPLTVSDSSDGNLTGHKTGVNLTIEPMCDGFTADDVLTVCVDSDYDMKYGGEYLLDEDSTGYNAIWTTTEGTEYYDDCIKITADTSDWAQIDYTFVNGTSGSWVSELSAIGDSKTWYITLNNDCGWSETITVNAIVVSYTA